MQITDQLSCQEVVELVTEYLEKTLLPQTQEQLEAHVAGCPGCTTYIRQIQQTVDMLRMLAAEPLFPETRQSLLRLFEQWKADGQITPLPTRPPTDNQT